MVKEELEAGITATEKNSGSNSKGDMPSAHELNEGLLKSVSELHSLSDVLHVFKCRWDDLQTHLDFIQTAIKELEPAVWEESNITSLQEAAVEVEVEEVEPEEVEPEEVEPEEVEPEEVEPEEVEPEEVEPEEAEPEEAEPEEAEPEEDEPVEDEPKEVEALAVEMVEEQLKETVAKLDDSTENNNKPLVPNEFEESCKTHGRFLKRSIISYLSSSRDVAKLRSDVTEAMKLSPNPPGLVLQAIGTFYLQGSRAYNKNSPLIGVRQACVLILELFLLTGFCSTDKISSSIKEECNSAAIAWRKRLIGEGGLSHASRFDARGLLLFIGAFGIPSVFKDDELRDLICLSNPIEISAALRQSHALMTRIVGIIEGSLKNGSKTEAIDFIYTFGIEDKFPPQEILTTLLRKLEESWKRAKKESPGLNRHEANKKNYAVLKSVQKCLKVHKIDPSKFESEWKINEKITFLEKKIANFDKQRKEENVYKRKAGPVESSRVEPEKRPRYTFSKPTLRPKEQRTVSDDGSTQRQSYLTAGNRSGYVNSFHPPSSAAMSARFGSSSSTVSNGAMSASSFPGILSTSSFPGILSPSSFPGILPTSSFPGVLNDSRADSSGLISNPSYPSQRWPVDQSFDRQPTSMGLSNLYQPPSSITSANRSSASNLYQFADAVGDGESYYIRGSHNSGTLNPATPAYPPSYRI